jgi:puromycin-sensitive aminopeptidase
MPQQKSHRLPDSVTPERYEIRLTPDLAGSTFVGQETVFLKIHRSTKEIILNAAEIEIKSVSVKGPNGNSMPGNASVDESNEQAVLTFAQALEPGLSQLHLTFAGILNDKLHGFYRSTYRDAQGQQKVLASTQFESTDARRAFPCWDEPAFKAVFQITLVVGEGLTAISNARIVQEKPVPGSGQKEIIFADTIKMSTYLVAFIVGEFEATEPTVVGAAPLRVWAVPGRRHLGRFAQQIGTFSLSFFSGYYDIPYPGDKLDLIAIPDFASGAMENLGAITFRETALLVDEERATRSELERVADVVSHENAHMWFGDLVTMRWWNGLWLNEAFATFMEMLAVDAWKPEWRRWDSFTVSRAAALHVDGLRSTRPIEFPVERPEEAAGMFDVLTYEKGASVLRMLEQYLEADRFRDGIRVYLQRHAYSNAETTDLWDALEDSSGQPVRSLMDSWIFQPGYPLITIERNGEGFRLSQRLFRYLQDAQDETRRWHVPVFLRAQTRTGAVNRTVLLSDSEQPIDFGAPVEMVVVNAGSHGFYRVRYGPDLFHALKNGLQQNLAPVERFNLVNDTWATTLAGLTSLGEYLDLLELLRDETNLNVWTTVLGSCHHLYRIFDAEQRSLFQARLREILLPPVSRLGWSPKPGESELDSQLRGELVSALGTLAEDKSTQQRAREFYQQFESAPKSVDRNIVPALIAIVAHTGAETEYEGFYANFKNAPTPQEEQRYLFALATFRRHDLIDKTLQLTLNGEVRTQNAPYLMRALLFNVEGREKAWRFMKDSWDEMLKKYPDSSIPRMCEGIVALATPELEADLRDFFARHPVKQGGRTIEQHLERLRIAVAAKGRWAGDLRS